MLHSAFVDRRGTLRVLTCCPPLQRVEMLVCLKAALRRLAGRHPDSAYVNDSVFAQITDRCLELAGVDPDWCNPAIVVELLYGKAPLLVDLNFPIGEPRTVGNCLDLEQGVARTIAALALSGVGWAEALRLARTEPWDLVDRLLQAAIDLKDPTSTESSESKEFLAEVGAMPIEEFLNFGGMLDGSLGVGNPAEAGRIAANRQG